MTSHLDGSVEVELPCPGCGYKNRKTIGWLQAHDQFTCAGCGKVDINTVGFRKGLREADAEIDKLSKSLNKTFRIKF